MRGVADHQLDARIVERALVHRAEVAARHLDHGCVEFGDHHALDRGMLEQLARGATVAAAEHQRPARLRMGQRVRVRHALVTDVFVADGGHRPAVEREQPAELRRVPDLSMRWCGEASASSRRAFGKP